MIIIFIMDEATATGREERRGEMNIVRQVKEEDVWHLVLLSLSLRVFVLCC